MKPDTLLSPFYLSSSHSSLPQALFVCKHAASYRANPALVLLGLRSEL